MGRRETYAEEYTPEIGSNAQLLVNRVNWLMDRLGIEEFRVTSGWRPVAVNRAARGAPRSAHLHGMAVDISDSDRALSAKLLENQTLLEEAGLYLEDPDHTPTWVHLQTRPTQSGNRVFKP